jgi:hypothetical protein
LFLMSLFRTLNPESKLLLGYRTQHVINTIVLVRVPSVPLSRETVAESDVRHKSVKVPDRLMLRKRVHVRKVIPTPTRDITGIALQGPVPSLEFIVVWIVNLTSLNLTSVPIESGVTFDAPHLGASG